MAFEIGKFLNDEICEKINASLGRQEVTKIALSVGMSFETARNLLLEDKTKRQVITDTNIGLVFALVQGAVNVNESVIKERESYNKFIGKFLRKIKQVEA